MALSCNFDAPNGSKSHLYTQLEEQLGSDNALKVWSWIRSEEFGKHYLTVQGGHYTYGEIIAHAKNEIQPGESLGETVKLLMEDTFKIPTDLNGEPTLAWMAANTKVGLKAGSAPTLVTKSIAVTNQQTIEAELRKFEDAAEGDDSLYDRGSKIAKVLKETYGLLQIMQDRLRGEEARIAEVSEDNYKAARDMYGDEMADHFKEEDAASLAKLKAEVATIQTSLTTSIDNIRAKDSLAQTGKPITVRGYHGAFQPFEGNFSLEKHGLTVGEEGSGTYKKGNVHVRPVIFATSSHAIAEEYTIDEEKAENHHTKEGRLKGKVGEVYNVDINFKNPLVLNVSGMMVTDARQVDAVIAAATERGHDGVILLNNNDSKFDIPEHNAATYIVFDDKQIVKASDPASETRDEIRTLEVKPAIKAVTDIIPSSKTKANRMAWDKALQSVQAVYEDAWKNPNRITDLTTIKATPVTKMGVTGYSPLELAYMFSSAPIPPNVKLSEDFAALIANTSRNQLASITAEEVPSLLMDEQSKRTFQEETQIPVLDENKQPTGRYFTAEQQVASVDTIVTQVWQAWSSALKQGVDPETTFTVGSLLSENEGKVYKDLTRWLRKYEQRYKLDPSLTEEVIEGRIANLQQVLRSWRPLAERAIARLSNMGLQVNSKGLGVVGEDTEETENTERAADTEAWYDSSFQKDPTDTASARIKMFLASIQETEVVMEQEPRRVALSFSDPVVRDRILGRDEIGGVKNVTFRTAAQLEAQKMEMGKSYITLIDDQKYRVTPQKVLTQQDIDNGTTIDGTEYDAGRLEFNAGEENLDLAPGMVAVKVEKWVPNPTKAQPKANFLGFPELVNYEELFQELLEITSGVTLGPGQHSMYDAMVAAIEDEAKNFRPNLYGVLERLKLEPEQIQREFTKVMSKQYSEFAISLYSRERSGMMKVTSINANRGSAVTSIVSQWRENQKHADAITKDASGALTVNREVASKFAAELTQVQEALKAEKFDVAKNYADRLLQANGIIIPTAALDYLFKHTSRLTKNTSLSGSITDQFGFTKEGQPRGIFSAIVAKLNGITAEDVDPERYLLNNNPLYTENTAMGILAKLTYRFTPATAAKSHRNAEGKTVYSFTMKTHLSSTMDQLVPNSDLVRKLGATYLGRNNWLLKRIAEGQAGDMELQYVDGLKNADRASSQGISRASMSTREQLLYAAGQFMNGGFGKRVNYLSLTHSDKTTTPLFTGVPKFVVKPSNTPKATQDAIYGTFLGEFERVRAWQQSRQQNGAGWSAPTTKNDSFNKGGGLYYMMPWLNHDRMQELVASKAVTPAEMKLLWADKGVPQTNVNTPALVELVSRLFRSEYLIPEVKALFNQMKEEGFIDNKLIDEGYVTNNLANAGLINASVYNNETGKRIGPMVVKHTNGSTLTDEQLVTHMLGYLSYDMATNYFLFHTAMSGMVFGDPALAYKPGKTSTKDYQRVEDSMKEYQKRLAKDIAPGQDPTWDEGPNENYRTITVKDDERIHSYLKEIPAYANAEINGSDAQEFTTVREHLYVMKAMGDISTQLYNEMVDVINEGLKSEDKYYEFTDPRHTAVVMQIMKPVTVEHNFDEVEGMSTIQYIKSSAMPLYPPMYRDKQLDELRKAMEGDGTPETHIPRANFISAKKMGAPAGKGVGIFDKNGDIKIDTAGQEWTTATQTLTRGGFRIQQEVPYDETKEAILTGSQDNKLFTQGISDLTDFSVRGLDRTISGTELKAMKEDVRKSLIQQTFDGFAKEVGIDEDGVANKAKLVELLRREAESRGYPANDVVMLKRMVDTYAPDGSPASDLAIPLFFNPSATKFESLLLSIIANRGKIYMPGKSYIQASSAGFKLKEKVNFEDLTSSQKDGIVWLKGPDGKAYWDGGDLKTMTKDQDDKVTAAQILLPFQFLVNGKPTNVSDYVGADGYLDSERVPKELTELIGFRIPTQKHNSMLPMQVVGFVPANMGDAIVVPAAITMQMGSDFDVDKLYVYRRPYKFVPGVEAMPGETIKGSKDRFAVHDNYVESRTSTMAQFLSTESGTPVEPTTESVTAALTKLEEGKTPEEIAELRERLGTATDVSSPSEEHLMTQYFDLHWAVLTHPEMYDTVMSPLDKPDLKAEAARARAAEGTKVTPYYSAKRQLDDFMSQKDAKVMVGISSLSVVFAAQVEDLNIRVAKEVENEDTNEKTKEPAGIRFREEGSDQVHMVYNISSKGEGKYYTTADGDPVDIELRGTSEGLKYMMVDPITGKVVGDAKDAVVEKRNKLDDLTSLQSEFLDHAKNRTIDQLNINLSTVNAALALSMMSSDDGAKTTLKHVSLLLRQPIIVDLVKELSRSQDSLTTAYTPDLLNSLVREKLETYMALAGITGVEDPAAELEEGGHTILDLKSLKEGIANKDATSDWYLQQAGALQIFKHLTDIGRQLSSIQRTFNQDPKGPGKNMISVLDTIDSRNGVFNNPLIAGAEDLFDTELGYIHSTQLNTARDAYSEILPYASIMPIVSAAKQLIGRDNLSVEDQYDISDHFKSFTFSNPELGLSANPYHDRLRLLYGTNTQQALATRVWEAKQTWGRDNYFLSRLDPQQAEIPNAPSYVFYLASRTSDLDDQENTIAFMQLLTSDNAEQKALGEDLVRYAYITGGISGGFSFIRHIPADYLIGLPFAGKLREVSKTLEATTGLDQLTGERYLRQWLQHNPAKAKQVVLEMFDLPVGQETLGERFELKPIDAEVARDPLMKRLLTTSEVGTTIYPQYLSFFDKADGRWKLYQKDGLYNFKRIDTLGNSYIREYNAASDNVRSSIAENRTLYKQAFRPAMAPVVNEDSKFTTNESTLDAYKLKLDRTMQNFEVVNVLKQIRDDKQVSTANKIIAEVYDGILSKTGAQLGLTLRLASKDAHMGTASTDGGVVLLGSAQEMQNHEFFASVLNHEIGHYLTFPFTTQSQSKLAAAHPEAMAAFEAVRESHQEAYDAVVKHLADLGITLDDAEAMLNGTKPTPASLALDIDKLYRVRNIDEFITSVTSVKSFQQFLNVKPSNLESSKTILGRFLEAFSRFIKALSESLGFNVVEGNQLEVATKRVFGLFEHVPEVAHTGINDLNAMNSIIRDFAGDNKFNTREEAEAVAAKIERDLVQVKVSIQEHDGVFSTKANFNEGFYHGFEPKMAFEEGELEVTNPVDKVYTRLQEQILDIQASLAKDKKTPEILRQRRLLSSLRAMAADLKATQDIKRVSAVAEYELKWAEGVAKQASMVNPIVTVNEIMTAYRLTGMWTDVIKLMYGDTEGEFAPDEAINNMQSKAQLLNQRFTANIMPKVLKMIANQELTDADFGINLQDTSAAEAKFLSIDRAKGKLAQEVALTIQNTNRNYLEEADRLVGRVAAFEAKAKAIASSKGVPVQALYDQMFQKGNHWGMVSRYSSNFYRWKARLRNKLTTRIDKIQTDTADPTVRASLIRGAYDQYWRDLRKNAGYIDVRVVFDTATGEHKDTPAATKFKEAMVKEYGEKLTHELLGEAQEKYKDFLRDKETTRQTFASEVANGIMTVDEAKEAIGAWDMENNPLNKLATSDGLASVNSARITERYLSLVPHREGKDFDGTPFFNDSYEKVQADDKMRELYEELQGFMNEFKGNLPYYMEDKLGPNFLPAIKNKLVTSISQVVPYVKSIKGKLLDKLTATEYEEFMQQRDRREIPIMYVDDPMGDMVKPGKGATAAEWEEYNKMAAERMKEYTTNLPRVLELFGMMSMHYKHFSDAKDAIDLGREVLAKADSDLRGGMHQVEVNGKKVTVKRGLSNTIGSIDYAIDALMYKRTKDLEGKFGQLNFKKKGVKVEQSVKELKTQVEEAKKQLRNNDITPEEYEEKMKAINQELDKYEVRKLYASKAGDFMITWAQLKALSYNPLSAVNNFTFGIISATIHANGGEDFGWPEFRRAMGVMMNSTGKSFRLTKLAGSDSAMATQSKKILAIMDRFGMMGELTDSDYGESNLHREKPSLKKTLSPYQMMRTGDYFCKGLNTIAVLMKEKVTVDGKEMPLWDALDNEGKFKFTDHPDASKYYDEDVTKQTEWQRLKNKTIAVNKIIMGNQDKSSPIWAKKNVLYRLLGQFRLSWFSEGIASRFETEREDAQLGRVRKGRYRTYADLGLFQSMGVLLKQVASTVSNIDPYANATLKDGKAMSDTDKANMRRNFSELAWMLMLYAAAHGIMALMPDDDDKKKLAKFGMNMLTRSYQDVALYTNAGVFNQILGTTAPALSTVSDVQKVFTEAHKLWTKDDYTFAKYLLTLTRAGFIPQSTLVNKIKTMTERDLNTLSH